VRKLVWLIFSVALGTSAVCGEDREAGWKRLFPIVASDQKKIWTFPASAAQGRHWKPVIGIAASTMALIASDPHAAAHFRDTSSFNGFNRLFSGSNTQWATLIVPASLYATGLIRRDSYQQKTALLAGIAVADTAILTTVMKAATSRLRPVDVPAGGSYGDTFFQSKGSNWLRGHGSFPSGHTVAAFAIATVIARRYPQHRRWLPYVSYGLAGVVGLSRVSLSSHFPSDVFAGAALGYAISRYAVLR
jgi:membrane-associated phospholipid phosphatase